MYTIYVNIIYDHYEDIYYNSIYYYYVSSAAESRYNSNCPSKLYPLNFLFNKHHGSLDKNCDAVILLKRNAVAVAESVLISPNLFPFERRILLKCA